MRPLEMALLIVGLGLLIVTKIRGLDNPRCRLWSALAAGAAVLLQLLAEGYRWQLLPGYAAPVLLLLGAWRRQRADRRKQYEQERTAMPVMPEGMIDAVELEGTLGESGLKRRKDRSRPERSGTRIAQTVGSWLAFALYSAAAVALPLLLPVFAFEEPSGPYAVGTVTYHWTDERREETATPEAGDKRELMVQIWYPADMKTARGAKPAPYIEHVPQVAQGLKAALSLPPALFSQLRWVEAHAYSGLPLAEGERTYPVLLFSHGMTGFRNQNTFQTEELASRGYIVVGIDHAYGAAAVVYPDGRVAKMQSNNQSGFKAYEESSRIWVDDVSFVLDQLEKANRSGGSGLLTGRLDLSRVGMFGHSFGGATAAQTLMKEERIRAAVNMDGTLYGSPVPEGGFGKPYLQLNGEGSIDKAKFDRTLEQAGITGEERQSYEDFWKESALRRERAASGGAYSAVFAHTNHMSFTDFYLFSPLLPPKGAPPRRIQEEINQLTTAFFDRYVKGDTSVTLEAAASGMQGVTLVKGQ